jgi:hypothetical protein
VRLFSYVVRWDHGFAPNPFYSVCSVATCKPDIRKVATVGDYVLGTGSAERKLAGKVVFLMRVDEIITFDQYWSDPRFARKIPVMNGSLQQRFGDNIYHHENGQWIQADSRHSQIGSLPNLKNLKRDTGKTDRVLLGRDFIYWGGEGPNVPARLSHFVHRTPAHRAFFSEDEIRRFLRWIATFGHSGLVRAPYEWRFEKRWR